MGINKDQIQEYLDSANAWLMQMQTAIIAYFKQIGRNEQIAWGIALFGLILVIIGIILF